MGIWETLTDLAEAALPWSAAEAEAPTAVEEEKPEETSAEEPAKEEAAEEPEAEAAEEEEEEEEEEDDDDDEPEDIQPKLEEECANSKQCHEPKHHFDECVERVTAAQDSEGGAKEDCVEEFFHLAHCATACAAPKLWSQLK